MGRTRDVRDTLDGERELRSKHANEPPRKSTRRDKGKGIATSSRTEHPRHARHSGHGNPVSEDLPETQAPWPRLDGTPFLGTRIPLAPSLGKKGMLEDTSYLNRQEGDSWARFNSVCYNGLLSVQILPTRTICPKMLQELGISDDVFACFKRIGLGTMPTKQFPLYPELVRQFLASCEVYYESDGHRNASSGYITYMIRGIVYKISFRRLCMIYGFDEAYERIEFPYRHGFRQLDKLWHLIGAGPANPRSMKLALIRNPVLRIIAKTLGYTLFCKEEPGALRLDELFLMHLAVPEFAHSIYTDYPREYGVNLGAAFATFLADRKFRGLDGPGKSRQEVCGSLLTPIFLHHGIDVSGTEVVAAPAFIDMQHLVQSRWIVKGKWQYTGLDGAVHGIELPTELVSLTSMDNVRFDPSTLAQSDDEIPLRTRKRRNVRSDAEDAGPSTGPATSGPMPPLPPYADQYAISPLPHAWANDERMTWHHRNLNKLHTMMTKVWEALSCTRASDAVPPTIPPLNTYHPTEPEDDDAEAEDDTDEAEQSDA